jgi:hypothetical protein
VSKKTDNQQAHSLISLYIVEYTAKFNKAPTINRYRDQWGFKAMIEDLGYERAQEVIKYFFDTNRPVKSLPALFSNYDRLDESMRELEEDEREREKLRRETAERVKEWQQRKQK